MQGVSVTPEIKPNRMKLLSIHGKHLNNDPNTKLFGGVGHTGPSLQRKSRCRKVNQIFQRRKELSCSIALDPADGKMKEKAW